MNNSRDRQLPLQSLRRLAITESPDVSDSGAAALATFSSQLIKLSLTYCNRIDGSCLEPLAAHLQSVTSLVLRGCERLTDSGLMHISQWVSLVSIDLEHCNRITDDGLRCLSGLYNLKQLNMCWGPRVTESAIAATLVPQEQKDALVTCCLLVNGAALTGSPRMSPLEMAVTLNKVRIVKVLADQLGADIGARIPEDAKHRLLLQPETAMKKLSRCWLNTVLTSL